MEASVPALKQPEFKLVGKDREFYLRFLKANHEERIRMRKEEAVFEKWHEDENVYYKKELRKFLKKIRKDPDLVEYVYGWSNNTVHIPCLLVIAQKASKSRNGDLYKYKKNVIPENSTGVFEKFELEKYTKCYVPPPERILITKNITFNENNVIPVFSDIPNENLKNLKLQDFFVYEYGDANMVDKTKDVNLVKAIELAKEEKNLIKCPCTDGRCYENEECPCFQVNRKLRSFQTTVNEEERTAFTSFKPILLAQTSNVMYDVVGFACSELCNCEGKCNNNALLLGQKSVFPLEMYRNDPNIGFCIRCPVPIPAGTPFTTFVGDLMDVRFLKSPAENYSYEAWRGDEVRMLDILEKTDFTTEYKTLLKALFRHSFQVNPTKYGNVGRTAGHSCVPNCELLRVYQKSLSPAHINLVMVALEDIVPGTPITIDYGKEYGERLKNVCGCGTFYCQNSKDKKNFKKMSYSDIAHCLQEIHRRKYDNYWENIQGHLVSPKDQKCQS